MNRPHKQWNPASLEAFSEVIKSVLPAFFLIAGVLIAAITIKYAEGNESTLIAGFTLAGNAIGSAGGLAQQTSKTNIQQEEGVGDIK